ncbi:MAG: anion permease [Clostridia bacterium]|nr:anion permease [Clostridia bacterium]
MSLIIFAVCVVLFIWNKLPQALVALLGLSAMVLTGTVTFADGFKNYGGYIIVLICSMMVVGEASFETGLAKLIGTKVLNLARGNERVVIMLATALTAVCSAFLSNIATFAIMIAILTGICAGNKNIKFMNVVLPVGMAAVIGGAATLVGSTPQLTAQGILQETFGEDMGFSFTTFLIPTGIIILLLVLYVGFIGYPLGKKIWGKRDEYNDIPVAEGEDVNAPAPNQKKMPIMIVIFVLTILGFIFSDQLKKLIPNCNLGMISLVSAILCVLTGCISHKKAIKSINWNLGIWFCACLGIAAGLDNSGGGELLANWFISLFGENVSPLVLYIALVVLVTVLTQFLSNSTVLAIVLPVVFSVTGRLGFNSYAFAVGLTISGAMAVATPLANSTIAMSMVAKYRFSDFVKYAGPITLMAIIVLSIVVPLLYPIAG